MIRSSVVSCPSRSTATSNAPCVFSVPAKTSSPMPFFGRQRLAGNRTLIDPRRAAEDAPVDGDPVAGPHDDDVVGPNVRDVYFLLVVSAADAGRMRPKFQQAGDARARAADGEIFQRLADEHDEDDFGRDEEPRRRIGPAPADPQGGHGREADGQVGGDLAARAGRVRRPSTWETRRSGPAAWPDRNRRSIVRRRVT